MNDQPTIKSVSCRDFIPLQLQWIPSHVGIFENEEADCLARNSFAVGPEVYILPLHFEILSQSKIEPLNLWKEYFNERSKTTGTKHFRVCLLVYIGRVRHKAARCGRITDSSQCGMGILYSYYCSRRALDAEHTLRIKNIQNSCDKFTLLQCE
ncbi:hypothetical protein K1T71_005287 [Dendrolimus kikuchii]|uniref:Uncharacterized protein n=1 Tax=Dendrolimus kikuchii TaxID=765133 RepID=A0ACC1D6X9_9NEOP|nr:hypothetical protein K1T71_005287 [Dendrolimus kikuchii]